MNLVETISGLFRGVKSTGKEGRAPGVQAKRDALDSIEARRRQDSARANDLARSAYENPGESFMNPPDVGGGGMDLGGLLSAIGGLFGKGPKSK